MRIRAPLVLLAALSMSACADGSPSAPDQAAATGERTRPSLALAEDRYPTQEEFNAEGGQAGGEIDYPTSEFGVGIFRGVGTGQFTWINEASVTLTVRVINNSDGTELNKGTDADGGSFYRPRAEVPVYTIAEPSTLNKTCGITGKTSFTGSAALKLLTSSSGSTITAWSYGPVTKAASDKTLPDCSREEETFMCEGMYVDDASDCAAGDGSGGGEGGGGGSTGGTVCELWEVVWWQSADGGVTWYEVDRWYEYRNCTDA